MAGQGGAAAAAGIEDHDRGRRSALGRARRLGASERPAEGRADQVACAQLKPEPTECRLAAIAHQAAVAGASTAPCSSSQRSASIAALQPSPAAVMAWR